MKNIVKLSLELKEGEEEMGAKEMGVDTEVLEEEGRGKEKMDSIHD